MKEIVLRVTNNTKNGLWVPGSEGNRGRMGCEAVNISEINEDDFGNRSHSDHGICEFPDHYMRLKPGESCEYVYEVPKKFHGNIKISVWSPWRNDKIELVDMDTKKAALKDGDQLIEEVEGIGLLK